MKRKYSNSSLCLQACFVCFLLCFISAASASNELKPKRIKGYIDFGDAPMKYHGASEPGAYKLFTRFDATVIDAGDPIEIDVLITGYGKIEAAKLAICPSAIIFADKDSYATIKIVPILDAKGMCVDYSYGGEKEPLDPYGATITMDGGITAEKWSEPTIFFDSPRKKLTRPKGPPIISTEETVFGKPMIRIHYQTLPKLRPGQYYVRLVLTYFNGKQWASSEQTIPFVVRNILQKHEFFAWSLALTAAVCTIVAMAPKGIATVYQRFGRIRAKFRRQLL